MVKGAGVTAAVAAAAATAVVVAEEVVVVVVVVVAGTMGTIGLGATVGFASSAGFLQTLENPKAGMAAGGDEARGAYRSLDASARLAKRSFLSDSLRASFALRGSVAIDERRE